MNDENIEQEGLFLLNKDKGISSFLAIKKLRKILGIKKVGHAGTLDPMAEGLMLVLFNRGTKFSEKLMKFDKTYKVEMELGYETDTYDLEGKIIKEFSGKISYDNKDIEKIISNFIGLQNQIPPMYSAIKKNGKKLYELARKGIEIEREPRKVNIYNIYNVFLKGTKIGFTTDVSSGTYIRSLVRDIGKATGYYATMTKLVRTKIDKYNIEDAVTLTEAEDIEYLKNKKCFLNMEELFNYKQIIINIEEKQKLKNGVKISLILENVVEKEILKVYSESRFVGFVEIVEATRNNVIVKKYKFFDN